MTDDRRIIPERRGAQLTIREMHASLIVNATVTDITERAAQTQIEVARMTHVRPKEIVMRYAVAGTVIVGIVALAVLAAIHVWGLDWRLGVGALAVIGVPFGIVASKVIPKLVEHAAAGPGGG